jgi:hypothetical protein
MVNINKETARQRQDCAVRFQKNEDDIASVKDDISNIKVQVNNHLPTAIQNLDEKIDNLRDIINKRPTWLMSGLFALLTGLIIYLLTH